MRSVKYKNSKGKEIQGFFAVFGFDTVGGDYSVRSGFTLIEMIVAVSLFTMVSFVAIGSLITIADANRKVNSLRTTMDNVNFAIESMSRDIRTGTGYSVTGDNKKISFTDQNGASVQYRYNVGQSTIQVKKDGSNFKDITSPEIKIESAKFYVAGAGSGDGIQPRVIIIVKGVAGIKGKTISTFNLQTTVSQRKLDS